MKPSLILCIVATFAAASLCLAQDRLTDWNGFKRVNFTVQGRDCFITLPPISAPGRPWVWRTSFTDFHPEVDLELLRHGWSIGYIECLDMLGCDASLDIMDAFFQEATTRRGLSQRPALEAVSRGGLHAYRYAARHPDRISCIYADTPVMNLSSWPLGWPGSQKETEDALKYYGLKDESALRAFRGNPIDLLGPIARARIPLRHVVSLNDQVVPPSQNTFLAQMRLKRFGHSMDVVTVKEGTADSNGHHFPLPEVFASARFIMTYSYVRAPQRKESFTLRRGLSNSRLKFEKGHLGRIVFLGGSITHNSGWRDELMRYFMQRFPNTKFDFIAAGVPSLGSVPHAFRLEQDVLSRGPVDLVFVEAAVNDHNYDGQPNASNLALRGMEGVVRHLLTANPLTDIVEMHFAHDQHLKTWREGKVPYTIAAHERVAARYGCPSLNLSREVYDRIEAGQMTWEGDFRDLHPSPYGHQLYANSMIRLLDAGYAVPSPSPQPNVLPKILDSASYSQGRFGELRSAKIVNGFSLDPSWKPNDGKETREGYVNVPALVSSEVDDTFEFQFSGSAVGLMITSGPDAGLIAFSVDGGPERTVNTVTPWSKSLHLPWALMLDDQLKPGRHTVRVRVATGVLRVFHFLLN